MIHTDLMLSGAVAQYGRGVGMIQATAAQIIGQFAGNLRAQLEQRALPSVPQAPPAPEPPAAPAESPCRPPRRCRCRCRTGSRAGGSCAATARQTDLRLVVDRARDLATDRGSVHRTQTLGIIACNAIIFA